MALNYAMYDVRTGRRRYIGPTTGAGGSNSTYGYPIWTAAEFHYLLNHIKNKMGFHVYANSHHGGIHRTAHSPNSWHYVRDAQGRSLAADIGTHGDRNERNRIVNELIPLLDRLGVAWHYARDGHVPGHHDHIHIDVSHWGRRGGSAASSYGFYTTRKKQDIYKALGGSAPAPSGGSAKDLNAGFTTARIKWAQEKLKQLGVYKDKIDGVRGPNTQKAIKAFQKSKGLKADGLPGKATSDALVAATTQKAVKKRKPRSVVANYGSKGELVKVVQRIVNVKQDGSFGNATREAVKAYQRGLGVTADGSWGPATTRAYFRKMGVRGPGDTGWAVRLVQYIVGVEMSGTYGPLTTHGVKEIQAWAGLKQDGYFGPNTQSKCII